MDASMKSTPYSASSSIVSDVNSCFALYPQFQEGTVLTEEFIDTLNETDQDTADQIDYGRCGQDVNDGQRTATAPGSL